MGEIDMITIDVTNEYDHPSVKPAVPNPPAPYGVFDLAYTLAQRQHAQLLQAAHAARLLKTSDGPAIDVQRWCANLKTEFLTLAERYARRAR
jgi:hypothetical protein